MQFNSYAYILCFLPLVIAGYYLLNAFHGILGKLLLIAASIVFYASFGWKMAAVLGLSAIFNYLSAKMIRRGGRHRGAMLAAAVLANAAPLFYLKYYNFFIENINLFFETEFNLKNRIIPLGISFFTFQQISWLVDAYKDEADDPGLTDYLIYILYFPKLLMGPITPPAEFFSQLNDPKRKRVNWDNIACGLKIFSFGLFKKMVLADTFSRAADWGFYNFDQATSMDFFLVMLFYTFEIYFDFSGYSDMAVGSSLMLNITLPMNFDSPYKALSIRDFWKRWHMSLTGFLTKYIYIPLGGSKKGRMRTCVNTMIVFVVSGIWHGASWTFILWGILHGALSVAERFFEKSRKKCMETVRWGATFLLVNLLWLLFRSGSVAQWREMLGKMFSFQDMSVSGGLIDVFNLPESGLLNELLHFEALNDNVRGFWMLLFAVSAFFICLVPENNYRKLLKNNYISMVLAAAAFVWGFLCLSSESVFVYFDF